MRFRRIYWVTEQFDSEGLSEVTGIYTSIPDLVETGLGTRDVCDKKAGFRLTLCELDSPGGPLISLGPTEFEEIVIRLEPLVATGELSREEVLSLREGLLKSK